MVAVNADVREVPMAEWGKDHWSLFAYLESLEVDGLPIDKRRMRCNGRRHPLHAVFKIDVDKPYPYGSLLRGMKVEPEHDDYDCIHDLEVAGLVVDAGTGLQPRPMLTPAGREIANQLREHKAGRGVFATFVPTFVGLASRKA